DRVARHAGRVVKVELRHHALPVLFDRLDADRELGGNLLVGVTLRDEAKDLDLSRGELAAIRRESPLSLGLGAIEDASYALGDRGAENRVVTVGGLHLVHD